MNTLRQILVGTLFAAAFQAAVAVPLSYEIGNGSSVTAYTGTSGLTINTSLVSGLSSVAFTLNDGQSTMFSFFDIWTTEDVLYTSDTKHKTISAYLDFAIPSPNSGTTVTGDTYGVATGFFGSIQYGAVVWDGPVTVTAGDCVFQITLSDETFNYGSLWGLGCGGATVVATVKQVRSTTTVPETSATLSLLGFGMLMIAGSRRLFAR